MNHWSEYFPLIFLPLMVIIFFVCAFFAIKWHFDQDKLVKEREAKENAAKVSSE